MSEISGSNLKSTGLDLRSRLDELEAVKKRSTDMVEETADNINHQALAVAAFSLSYADMDEGSATRILVKAMFV